MTTQPGAVDVYTTLDLNMQRAALDAVRNGLGQRGQAAGEAQAQAGIRAGGAAGRRSAHRRDSRDGRRPLAQPVATTAQSKRAASRDRYSPFVYLAAFEQAAQEGWTDLTPASLTLDEPATFTFDDQVWEPKNYDDYDGEVTLRRALAMSRNLGTIRVGERIGFDKIARCGGGWRRHHTERLSLDHARRLRADADGGGPGLHAVHQWRFSPRTASHRRSHPGRHEELSSRHRRSVRNVAQSDTTYLVTNMMRSVLTEGTGAGARASGFRLDAAGKSGTTNDLRDAWFVGFTELLTVVWVGLDDNQPLGLTARPRRCPSGPSS